VKKQEFDSRVESEKERLAKEAKDLDKLDIEAEKDILKIKQ
jgi:hypothetical protein